MFLQKRKQEPTVHNKMKYYEKGIGSNFYQTYQNPIPFFQNLCYPIHGDNMTQFKKIIFLTKEIVVTYLLGYIIIILACLLYTLLGYKDLTSFINTKCCYLILFYYIITIIYLYRHNKKQEPPLPSKQIFPLLYLGISLATVMNMLIFKIIIPTTSRTIPLPLALISSGLIGPIYEEILFRYILLNRLKLFHSKTKAILINTILFALMHLTPIKIIYAFILGLFLNISYEKHKNILAPILIHIAANSIVVFLTEYNPYILLLATINLIISLILNKK